MRCLNWVWSPDPSPSNGHIQTCARQVFPWTRAWACTSRVPTEMWQLEDRLAGIISGKILSVFHQTVNVKEEKAHKLVKFLEQKQNEAILQVYQCNSLSGVAVSWGACNPGGQTLKVWQVPLQLPWGRRAQGPRAAHQPFRLPHSSRKMCVLHWSLLKKWQQ